ncbi:hypothetical protein ACIPUO_06450 [Pectobacterium carotovorum]|uniref:hypothetical protein n=1 Tax=Pectobacterium carotovorum TaxID=554 RepID=UPI0020BD62F3|nr:hypothetical protein [Pectobacterium carotovorum]
MIKNITIGVLISAILAWILLSKITPMTHADILMIASVISTVSGILFGFVLAAISIFSSASSNRDGIIHALKQNKILPKLIKDLLSTGVLLIAACVFPLISMFFTQESKIGSIRCDFIMIILGFSFLLTAITSFGLSWRRINWILPHI